MKLINISIAGFRSIEKLDELEIHTPTILAGHNDAGKTSVLDAISFLLGDIHLEESDRTYERSDGLLDIDSEDDFERPRVSETIVQGHFKLSDAEAKALNLPGELKYRRRFTSEETFNEVHVEVPNDDTFLGYRSMNLEPLKNLARAHGIAVQGTKKENYLAAIDEHVEGLETHWDWVSADKNTIEMLPAVLRFSQDASSSAENILAKVLTNSLTSIIKDDGFPEEIDRISAAIGERLAGEANDIAKHIQAQCEGVSDVRVIPEVGVRASVASVALQLTSDSGEAIPLGTSGSGTERRVSLAVWEYVNELVGGLGDLVVLYDEPDDHLDFHHQRKLMKTIDSQCLHENVSMVIATHSMNLIDGIDISSVVHLRHEDSRTQKDTLQDDTSVGIHLGAIASSLGLRNTVLLHERLFVGVEGPTELASFPVLFKRLKGRQLESYGIVLWNCENGLGAIRFAEFLRNNNRKTMFVVDRDTTTNNGGVSIKQLRTAGFNDNEILMVGNPNEYEDTFPNNVWAKISNEVWPKSNGGNWREEDFEQHRKSKFSSDVLNMLKEGSEDGPRNKSTIMTELALRITDPSAIPQEIVDIFDRLIKEADY